MDTHLMMKTLKILVIDDEQLIRWSFEKQLSSRGYKVFSAEDGEEGLKLFELNEPARSGVQWFVPILRPTKSAETVPLRHAVVRAAMTVLVRFMIIYRKFQDVEFYHICVLCLC